MLTFSPGFTPLQTVTSKNKSFCNRKLDLMCSRMWKVAELLLAILLLSLWLAMAIVIFISHGRQEYCLTKHLVTI
jgi:hypothetical protein